MAAIGNYYFNGSSFAQATAIYTDAGLTTLAPDGFYSNAGIVRQQLNGVLLNAQTCTSCATPCGSGVSASNNGNGMYSATVDLANDTGAVVFYGFFGSTVPDGVRLTWNSGVVNRFTTDDNHNGVTIQDGSGTTVDYAGLNNAAGEYTYMGRNNTNLIGDSPYNNTPSGGACQAGDQPEDFVLTGGNYVAQGTFQNVTVSNNMVGTCGSATAVFATVVPKSNITPTILLVEVSAPMCGTFFQWQVDCPTTLPSFLGSALQATTACANADETYYFVPNATRVGQTITPDTNTTPEIGNFVYTQSNGSIYLNDTNTLQYIIVGGTTALGIRNGVVVSSASCSGSPSLTAFFASVSQTFNQICGPGAVPAPSDETYYHSGSASYPIAGDTVYTTSAGTTALAAGLYFTFGGGGSNTYFEIQGSEGIVTTVTSCIPE
tara:strand:+ start:20835 stop:22133 length:1299 start_codon:yes stop_codon:yes gene_type:complete